MIKFEGFELKNIEDAIINRQPRTRPFIITAVAKPLMEALGAKKGSTSWEKKSFQTEEQQKLFKDTLKGYGDLEYKDAGEFQQGTKADELEGFKARPESELRSLQDEGNLSIKGIEALRNMRAESASKVSPYADKLREMGDNAWSGREAHMKDVYQRATDELQQADISARRGGMGGTALARLAGRNVAKFADTTTTAAAKVAEQTAMERQRLGMQAYAQAGGLTMEGERLGLQALQGSGALESQQNQMALTDLMDRRGHTQRGRMFQAQNEMERARYSQEQAQAQNLWQQQASAQQNQFNLQKLQDQIRASSMRTFKNVKNVTKGSSGLGGALITAGATAAGAYFGGPAGAQLGSSLGQAAVGGMGYEDGGGSVGSLANAAANMYAQNPGMFSDTGGSVGAGPQGMATANAGTATPSWGTGQFQDPQSKLTVPQLADAYGQQGGGAFWFGNNPGMQGSHNNIPSQEVAQLRAFNPNNISGGGGPDPYKTNYTTPAPNVARDPMYGAYFGGNQYYG